MALVHGMLDTGIRPDFVSVDGTEGGTGAAPVEFQNSIGMPLSEGLRLLHTLLEGSQPSTPSTPPPNQTHGPPAPPNPPPEHPPLTPPLHPSPTPSNPSPKPSPNPSPQHLLPPPPPPLQEPT